MANRGDVLVARRRLGFGSDGTREHFVVLSATAFGHSMDRVLVAPLDERLVLYDSDPLVVPVSAKEAGTSSAQVALPAFLSSVSLDRFDIEPSGHVRPTTLSKLDRNLRILLDLK